MEIIDATNRITIPDGGPVRIMPLGDIQYGSQDTNVDLLKKWVSYASKQRAYMIGLGDYTDFMSPSNRQRFDAAAIYDNSRESIDEWVREQVQELGDILLPLRGRCLGLLHGHHYWTYLDGTTSDMQLASRLEAPYLGTTAMVGIKFKGFGTFTLWATHGAGGGVTAAGHLGKLERLSAAFDAHVFIMAHVTKRAVARTQQLVVNWKTGKLAALDRVIMSTGGFMGGYTEGRELGGQPQGSYVELKMLTPTALGAAMITVRPAMTEGIFTPDIAVEV